MDEKDIHNKEAELNSLLTEMVKNQKSNYKNLIRVFIITIIAYTVLLVSMVVGFFVYESQFEIQETIDRDIQITQEADGNSDINNVAGNMYKDNAIHNEGK